MKCSSSGAAPLRPPGTDPLAVCPGADRQQTGRQEFVSGNRKMIKIYQGLTSNVTLG
ncbi:protein of unknown function [Methylorubrum extorquens]|uniref:Uncharacterized protein n=1 Tax=Methylorubrum extorquens TaxID=408 RepID=A0A2N9AZI9_METEX|nr:protein of unknown function [Methylorubrum extorquens]